MKQLAEKVRTGGLTGQGYSNLLGRPRLGALQLVLREAVQNSWDARKRRGNVTVRFSVRVRNLVGEEDRQFRRIFDQQHSFEPSSRNTLARHLRDRSPIRVLELSDYGTVGLTGATRPDLPTDGVDSRFVNFFFDFGKSHEDSGDAGTYGFGRSSLYVAGKASVILVDSLTEDGSRRLMACRIGEAFEVSRGVARGRYLGRHFWGDIDGDIVQPLTGQSAAKTASHLGLPPRIGVAQSGTTVMIPWPVDGFESGSLVIKTIVHHLWPKMVPTTAHPTIAFEVSIDGTSFRVPDPTALDDYRLFVKALKTARTQRESAGARPITTLRPRHRTGFLGIELGATTTPAAIAATEDDSEESEPPSPLNQIALMRPSELVVRYLPVSGTELVGQKWAAVFIADDESFVRTAFARSEPPAHDDWIADRLKDKPERYIVKKTVSSLLPETIRSVLGVGAGGIEGDGGSGASLAAASGRFSSTFLSGDGQGPSAVGGGRTNLGGGGGGGGGVVGQARVSTPIAEGLEVRKNARVANFKMKVTGKPSRRVTLLATPRIHADGVLETPPEGIKEPSVLAWSGGVSKGDRCEVTIDRTGFKEVHVSVQFHDDYGLTLDCVIEREAP